MLRWRRLAEKTRPVARRIGPHLEVTYPLDAQVGDELEYLVAAERRCCQFVDWDLIDRGDILVLRIAAHPERPDDIESFADLFGVSPNGG
ncbi:MAG TPA: hypothetical protein VND67_10590 [Acidimicrobiales bacterium]|nr:hypothetical protein [Acidimicrobiales bacterium]